VAKAATAGESGFNLANFGKGFVRKGDVVSRAADGKIKWGETLARSAGRYARYKTEKELRKTEEGNALANFGGVFLDG
jgi:hypothetical protein